MVKEALLSSSAVGEVNSPRDLAQEDNPQFIKSIRDIERRLVSDWLTFGPIKLSYDLYGAVKDGYRSLREHYDLVHDPISEGEGVPRGDGSPVIILGGLASIEQNYSALVRSLIGANWNAMTVPWGVNLPPIKEKAELLKKCVRERVKSSGRKAKIIGHSLGGEEEMEFFAGNPEEFVDLIDHVVFIGAPRPTRLNSAVSLFCTAILKWMNPDEYLEIDEKAHLLKTLADAGLVKTTSIDSRADPIIGGPFYGRAQDHFDIEAATHTGLATNKDTVAIVTHQFMDAEIDFRRYPNIHRLSEAA